jgi:predicted RNase H-like nuclease (RuvC/YqgF family)
MMSVSTLGFAQDNNRNDELEKSLQKLKSENRILWNRVSELESSLFSVQNTVNQSKEEIKTEIRKSQELQAQNERAMNISLDEFSKKFEEQNKTVVGVKDELSKKFNDQMMFGGIAFVLLLVVFSIVNKSSTKKALSQNQANWNQFQEHLLKK